MFGILEYLASNKEKIGEFLKVIKCSRDRVAESGFTASTIEDFYQEFEGCVTTLQSKSSSVDTVEKMFEEGGGEQGNYAVFYSRLLTSAHIRLHKEEFIPFIERYPSVETFCGAEVEPMHVEAEQLQLLALTRELDMPVEIVYLDQSNQGDYPALYIFPEGRVPCVRLLYRPGHYDLIYLD